MSHFHLEDVCSVLLGVLNRVFTVRLTSGNNALADSDLTM